MNEIIGHVYGYRFLQDKGVFERFLGVPRGPAAAYAALSAYTPVWRYVFLQAPGTAHVFTVGQGEGVEKMICEQIDKCAFMEHMNKADPLTAHTVKLTYCDHDKYGCARYGLFQAVGADNVPDFLWPNDEEEALEVIKIKARSKNRDENFVSNDFR